MLNSALDNPCLFTHGYPNACLGEESECFEMLFVVVLVVVLVYVFMKICLFVHADPKQIQMQENICFFKGKHVFQQTMA